MLSFNKSSGWLPILVVGLVIAGSVRPAAAANINATSCSQTHVQSAIAAAVTGDKVLVPAGTCTWAVSSHHPQHQGNHTRGKGHRSDHHHRCTHRQRGHPVDRGQLLFPDHRLHFRFQGNLQDRAPRFRGGQRGRA